MLPGGPCLPKTTVGTLLKQGEGEEESYERETKEGLPRSQLKLLATVHLSVSGVSSWAPRTWPCLNVSVISSFKGFL